MKTIKILHVIGIMNYGGAETMIMNLYRKIDRQKFQFDFVKVMSNPYYMVEDTGLELCPPPDALHTVTRSPTRLPIQTPQDWKRLPLPQLHKGALAREEEAIRQGKPLREQDIIGRLYATPRLALASVNQGYMWNQTRPLIAHWGDNVQTPAYMQVRFLHDGYDFSAVNIFCAQDSTNVVALFNIATDGGDTHPNLDRLQNATFEAEDLRLRIQFGGTPVRTATLTLPQKRDGFTQFTCGDIHARLQVPYANWDKAKGHWEAGSDGATQWADFVLYSGKKKTFRLDEVREAVVALYLSFSTNPDMPKGKSTVRRQGGYLTLSYSTPGHAPLQVTALAKPADERRIKADYATRSPQPGQ